MNKKLQAAVERLRDEAAINLKSMADDPLAADILTVCAAVEEAERQLDLLYSSDPCPECGHGVSADCLGCKLKAAEARIKELCETYGFSHAPTVMAAKKERIAALEADNQESDREEGMPWGDQ